MPTRPPREVGCLSDHAHLVGLQTLLALHDLEFDALALLKASVARPDDRRVVDEYVLTTVDGDEAVALFGVEPLDGALCHLYFGPSLQGLMRHPRSTGAGCCTARLPPDGTG